jgi:hypothetical protein
MPLDLAGCTVGRRSESEYLGRIPDCPRIPATHDTWCEGHMQRDELCVCGHPQSLHRTYGCNGTLPNPDLKKTNRVGCPCKAFKAGKAAHA